MKEEEEEEDGEEEVRGADRLAICVIVAQDRHSIHNDFSCT